MKGKKKNGVTVLYRRGSWEVKRGMGRWKSKYTSSLTEDEVRKNLGLEYPGNPIIRFKTASKKK